MHPQIRKISSAVHFTAFRWTRASSHSCGRRFTPMGAIQALAEEGYLDHEPARRLRAMTAARDAVVHGDLSFEVTAEQVDRVFRDLRRVAEEIAALA